MRRNKKTRLKIILLSIRKLGFILISLLIGGFVGYGINQSFKVSESKQINLLLQDIQAYILEIQAITDLSGQGLGLAEQACKLECARDIACFSNALEKAGNLDGQLKVHGDNAEKLRESINERYKSIWLDEYVEVEVEPLSGRKRNN